MIIQVKTAAIAKLVFVVVEPMTVKWRDTKILAGRGHLSVYRCVCVCGGGGPLQASGLAYYFGDVPLNPTTDTYSCSTACSLWNGSCRGGLQKST